MEQPLTVFATDLFRLFGHTPLCQPMGFRMACPSCGMTLAQWLAVEEARRELAKVCVAHAKKTER